MNLHRKAKRRGLLYTKLNGKRMKDTNADAGMLQAFQNFKVVTYIPEETLEDLLDALREVTVNEIGAYRNCVTWYPVRSIWTSLEKADPYLGIPGEESRECELKVEFLCHREKVRETIQAILRVHPYEEPVIDIVPMLLAGEWKD